MADVRIVIITGLSGAGKSEAIRTFEDMGFFCIDNLPPLLIPKFAEIIGQPGGKINRSALVVDIRGRDFFDHTLQALEELEQNGFAYHILFLEASDETLVRRYKESRRRHPLAPQGRILDGIREERRRLEQLRGKANYIIDTTGLSPRQLRDRITSTFAGEFEFSNLTVNLVSFGFKHGLPLDADLVLDVRFLPNPHYVPSLRPLTGNEKEVAEYVMKWPSTKNFLRHLSGLMEFLLPQYVNEGKSQLTVAVGCTGGQHRSVVVVNYLADLMRSQGFPVHVEHRDAGNPPPEPEGEKE